MVFGNLKVIGVHKECERNRLSWLVQCQCGSNYCFAVDGRSLRNNHNVSCPFCKKNVASKHHKTHGDSYSRIYRIYRGMLFRCYNPNCEAYHNYGGRGIEVCDEWKDSYIAFRDWSFTHGYDKTLTLDRINVDKGYSPDNCRWATTEVQGNNKQDTVYLTVFGVTKPLSIWAKETGINKNAIYYRYHSKTFTTDEEILYGKDLIYFRKDN